MKFCSQDAAYACLAVSSLTEQLFDLAPVTWGHYRPLWDWRIFLHLTAFFTAHPTFFKQKRALRYRRDFVVPRCPWLNSKSADHASADALVLITAFAVLSVLFSAGLECQPVLELTNVITLR